jgi:hypothetical protein
MKQDETGKENIFIIGVVPLNDSDSLFPGCMSSLRIKRGVYVYNAVDELFVEFYVIESERDDYTESCHVLLESEPIFFYCGKYHDGVLYAEALRQLDEGDKRG